MVLTGTGELTDLLLVRVLLLRSTLKTAKPYSANARCTRAEANKRVEKCVNVCGGMRGKN